MSIYKKNYEDIINLQHKISLKYPRMSLENRSAQFAPFAALTGYDDEIKETERITEQKIEISEEIKIDLNKKIQEIQENINQKPKVSIKYYIPDSKKQGGKYLSITSNVIKLDQYKKIIILENKICIPIICITDINFADTN